MSRPAIITCPNCGNEHGEFAVHRCKAMPNKRPVAFRVEHNGVVFLSSDEDAARLYAERRGLDYQGLSMPGEREKAIRECAEIAKNGAKQCVEGNGEWYRGFRYAANNTALGIADAILALLDQPAEKK